ncbi:MAG: zinc ribbon domain-containing protein [Natrialbaceae archaeon]|nr:zinc ribbon domain-containing protein [Natrialbaceae archaeon]
MGQPSTGSRFAASRPPIAEEDIAARLGAMLDLPDTGTRRVMAGSTRAGTEALMGAMAAISGGAGRALVVAADAPRGAPESAIDHAAGAGAAAFVLEAEGPATITDTRSYATVAPGTRFRGVSEGSADGLGVTQYDRQSYIETVSEAIDQLDASDEPDAIALQAPDGSLPYRVAGAVGDTDSIQAGSTVHRLGDLGAASVPVSLASAMADGHDQLLACSFASGASADALAIRVDADVPHELALEGETELTYAEYLRVRGEITSGAPSGGGAYVSLPTWTQSIEQRYHLEAGRCPACGALAFPPRGACPDCGELSTYEPVRLPGTGTVEAIDDDRSGWGTAGVCRAATPAR